MNGECGRKVRGESHPLKRVHSIGYPTIYILEVSGGEAACLHKDIGVSSELDLDLKTIFSIYIAFRYYSHYFIMAVYVAGRY